MAGDWIKMRSNLWDDPRVAGICDRTNASEAQIIGALYWLWTTADQHTKDGFMGGLTKASINRKTAVDGFAEALIEVGWLEDVDGGLSIPRFDEHNGSSAKRRASEAKRKGSVRNVSACDADKKRTASRQHAELEREEEEESSVSKDTGADAPPKNQSQSPNDPSKALWDLWVDYVGDSPHNRSVLGKLIKEHGETDVREAVATTIAKRPADPMAYMRACLKPRRRFVC
jgi:hypothetical protein